MLNLKHIVGTVIQDQQQQNMAVSGLGRISSNRTTFTTFFLLSNAWTSPLLDLTTASIPLYCCNQEARPGKAVAAAVTP